MYKSKQQQTLTSDVNAESYRDDDTVTIFAKREKSNKREYGERIRSQDIRIYEIFKKISGKSTEASPHRYLVLMEVW